ncbi:MAG: hypothetical protein CM15mV84_050 [uncultured marine virus]|nr:MAG: hypothetical protein CM15mV84_050 [uncultured marine virus]
MTPLLPNPDYYLHNLITMTSSESKRLWRRAIKEHFNCTCVYCGEFHELHNLTIDHVRPKCRGVRIQRRMLYPRVDDAIRTKVVENGKTG